MPRWASTFPLWFGTIVLVWASARNEAFWRGVRWESERWQRMTLKQQVEGLEGVLSEEDDIPDEVRAMMQKTLREHKERLTELGE